MKVQKALIVCLLGFSMGVSYAADELGQTALRKLGEGQKLSTLTVPERQAALHVIEENYRIREGLLKQVAAREADAALLEDQEFKKALLAPDPNDQFVLSLTDANSTYSRYSARLELEMEAPLLPGFGGPCNINYSVRPGTEPPTGFNVVVSHPPAIINIEDSIPGNAEFDVFRLSQEALDQGTTITHARYDKADRKAEIRIAMPESWSPKNATLGEFIFRGVKAGSGPVEFTSGTRALRGGKDDYSQDVKDVLFTDAEVEVIQ